MLENAGWENISSFTKTQRCWKKTRKQQLPSGNTGIKCCSVDPNSVQETYFSQFNGYYFTGDGCKRDKELVMVHPETGRVKEKSSLKMD